jgi:uncharacterized membrane protein (UPF0127 family)
VHRFILFACTLCISFLIGLSSLQADFGSYQVRIGYHTFHVEIADTPELQHKGLMERPNLPKNKGMLFVFNRDDQHSFWMKNTYIPLDIIWIDNSNTIVHIKNEATPKSLEILTPPTQARYVLEINGGLAQKYLFYVGQHVLIIPKLKSTAYGN